MEGPTNSEYINYLLAKSAEFEHDLKEYLLLPFNKYSDRHSASRTFCSICIQHGESSKILASAGNHISATAMQRLQYEALVRAIWSFYTATDTEISKLTDELNEQTSKRSNSLPMLSKMLEKMEGTVPERAIEILNEIKHYSWKHLSSYVHGGIHAVRRHNDGYPEGLMTQLIKQSNGMTYLAGSQLLLLAGDTNSHYFINHQSYTEKHKDCLPDHAKHRGLNN